MANLRALSRIPLLCGALLAGCAGKAKAPAVKAAAPEGFAQRDGTRKEARFLSPDGVLYSVRLIPNKPEADLAFWSSALKTRMSQAGYRVLGDSSISLGGTAGTLLRLAAPLGQKDYLYFVAITVRGKEIRVAEAAGEAARFRAREAEILKALATP